MRVNPHILFFLIACFLIACNNRPSHVLTEKQMEDILYDLYIAEAEVKQNESIFYRDSLLKKDILISVFDKHHITEEKFDASLIWYNDNLDKYVKINERLADRYAIEIEKLRIQSEQEKSKLQLTDSVLLYSAKSILLEKALRENIFSFMITDSWELNQYKRYNVDFLPIGIKASVYPILTFSIQCPDTIFVFQDTIKTNSWYSNSYGVGSNYSISAVYGSIYLPAEATDPVFINDFSVIQQKPKDLSEPRFKIQ